MSKLLELTTEFSVDRSPKRFLFPTFEGSERDAGKPCRANISSSRRFFGPADVRNLRELAMNRTFTLHLVERVEA
jgi:hypothetical protein